VAFCFSIIYFWLREKIEPLFVLQEQIAISGRVRWAGKPTVRPFHRIGFHGIDLTALHAAQLGFAGPVGHRQHEPFALRAALIVHGVLPVLGTI
jgi:hypothetical protein